MTATDANVRYAAPARRIVELEDIIATQTRFVESGARSVAYAERIYGATHSNKDWTAYVDAQSSLDARVERLAQRLMHLRKARGESLADPAREEEVCQAVAQSTRDIFVIRAFDEIKPIR